MATIAKGVVRIDGKDNTKKAFDSAKKSAISLEKVMKVAAAAVVAVAGAKAMGKMISSTLDLADSIGKLSKNTGMSVEFIQTYGRVMGEAGIDQGQADKSLETFNKRLGEMRSGLGAMKGPLEAYSQELADQVAGAKNSEEAVKILIGAMESMEDPAEKAALASAAFGTQVGKKMPAMMTEGAGSFDRAASEILKTTTLLNAGQIEQAQVANDMMARVGGAWESAKNSIVVGAAGPIIEACEWMLEKAYPAVKEFFTGVGEAWDMYAAPGIDLMLQWFDALMGKLGPSIQMVKDGVEAVMAALGVAWDKYAEPGMNRMLEFFAIIAPYVEPIIDMLVLTIETAFRVIGKVWELAKPGMDKFVEVVENVWNVVGPIFEIGVAAIGTVLQLFGGFFSGVIEEINKWVDGTSSLLDVFGAVWTGWVDLVNGALDVFKSLFSDLTAPVQAAFDAVTNIVGKAIDWIVEKVKWMGSFLPDWMNPFAKSAETSSASATKSVSTASSGIGKSFDSVMSDAKGAATGMASSFKSMTTAASKWASDFASNVTGKMSGAWQSITGFFKGGSKNAVKEMKTMTTGAVAEAKKLNNGVSKEFDKVESYSSKRMALMRGKVNKSGEGIVNDAVGNSWAKDWSILVPKAFEKGADESVAAVKGMRDDIDKYATEVTETYSRAMDGMVSDNASAYGEMEDDTKSFVNSVQGTLSGMFEKLFTGDIQGAFGGVLDAMKNMVIKFAADVASEFVTDKLFGGGGGEGSKLGMISKLFSGGGGGGAAGGSGGILGKLGGLFGKSSTSSGVLSAGGATGGAGGAGGAASAAGGGGLSAMAGAAVPLAIFGFGMYMSSNQAKKDKEEYLGIINDIALAENMASEAIGNGYVGIGEKGGTAYVQVSEAMARHLEQTQSGITFIGNMTDEYGNMIVKASDYDLLMKEATWAETHLNAVDSIMAIHDAYGEMGPNAKETTRSIQEATNRLVDDQEMVVMKTAAMADGFISAGEAMDMGITRAAGMSSAEFQNLIDDTNAVKYGLTSMSADGVKALSKIDTSTGRAAHVMSTGFVSSVEMARMGISGLGDMSSTMFESMISYAQNAQGQMDGLATAANRAGAASASAASASRGMKGYMTGGSFMVGGQGGLDNNIVAFKASNNERVTVETPEQQRNGSSDKSSFSVEDLIEYVTKPIVGAVQKQSIIAASAARH